MASYTSDNNKFEQLFLMFLREAQKDAGKNLNDDINSTFPPAAKLNYETSHALLIQVIDFFSTVANLNNTGKKETAKHELPKSKASTANKEATKHHKPASTSSTTKETGKHQEITSTFDAAEKETAKTHNPTANVDNTENKETTKAHKLLSNIENTSRNEITEHNISTLKTNAANKEIPKHYCTCRKCKANTAKREITNFLKLTDEISTLGLETPITTSTPLRLFCQTNRKVIIHCLRHAHVSPLSPLSHQNILTNTNQAEHNVRPSSMNPKPMRILDPPLTLLGHKQALSLRQTFVPMHRITHIVCSPMKRTLQTAVIGFRSLLEKGMTILAWPDLRECGSCNASIGSPLEELKGFVNGNPVDLALVEQGWEVKTDKNPEECKERVQWVRNALWRLAVAILETDYRRNQENGEKDEKETVDIEILVVSHGSFLKELLNASGMYRSICVLDIEPEEMV